MQDSSMIYENKYKIYKVRLGYYKPPNRSAKDRASHALQIPRNITISSDNRCLMEIRWRINMTKKAFLRKKTIVNK